MSRNREIQLTLQGNYGLVAKNTDIISTNEGQVYTPQLVGTPVLYDPNTMKALEAADLTNQSIKDFRFGVYYNPNGGRIGTHIRHLGGADVNLCRSSIGGEVQAPACATPQVLDFEFDCTWTGENYSVKLEVDDWFTKAYFKEGTYGPIVIDMGSEVDSCDSCSEEENCDIIACQLASKITGKWLQNFKGVSRLGLDTSKPNHGLWAVKKFTNNVSFTLADSAVEAGCESGCAVKALKTFDATGIDAITFSGVTDPSAPTQTLHEQLDSVINQINIAIEGKGSAYLKKVDCCSYTIEINSCLEGLAMTYHDDASVTSASTAAFESFENDPNCKGCDGATSKTFTCGVRIYVNPLEFPCHCEYPDGNPPSYYGRSVRLSVLGEAWDGTPYRVKEVQSQTLWTGTGYQVQQREMRVDHGGEGFDYDLGADMAPGDIPRPLPGTRYAETIAKCDAMYCMWSVNVDTQIASQNHGAGVFNNSSLTHINVRKDHTTAVAAVQNVLAKLEERGVCKDFDYECIDLG